MPPSALEALAALTRDPDGLADQAAPITRKDPTRVDVADIPLPPAHLVDELDNSGMAAAAEPEPDDAPVTLDFVGDELPEFKRVLKYPFRWEGVIWREVTVRQLTVEQVGRISGQWSKSGKAPELYEIYAEMTGLPAKVIRKLPDVDGLPIVDAAYGFLPPSFRPEDG